MRIKGSLKLKIANQTLCDSLLTLDIFGRFSFSTGHLDVGFISKKLFYHGEVKS